MPALRQFIVDAYSALSHKQPVGDGGTQIPSRSWIAPTWVGIDHRRRLAAYAVRAAYLGNVGRYYLPIDDVDKREHREYGDADLLRSRVVGGVLGETWDVVIDGADVDLPDEPDLSPEPPDPKPDDSDVRRRVLTLRRERWDAEAAVVVDEWEAAWREQPSLQARQEWLRDWVDDEQLKAKIVEMEGDAAGLGDGVLAMFWRPSKQRATVAVYPPDAYFPVLDENSTEDWPTKVHLAWEFEGLDHNGTRTQYVRRQTWELGPIEGVPDDTGVGLDDGDTIDPVTGLIVRPYPWNVDEGGSVEPAGMTCFFSDGTWPLNELGSRQAGDFDDAKAQWATDENGDVVRRLDLRIDFIPVIHVPNTPDSREHFGRSVIDIVAQVLDDIAATDSDVQRAQSLAAGPVIHVSGAGVATGPDGTARLSMHPGAVWRTAAGGTMDVLDLSAGLSSVRESRDDLLDRLSVNARVPAEVLGRVKASDVPSGVALALAFSPFNQLVGTLRMTREPKYRLLLKFAQRMAMAAGVLEPGPALPARIAFGSFLPSDEQALIASVASLLQAHAISTQTAVATLVAGGWEIQDAEGEVERIRQDAPQNALFLAEALNSEQGAADYLGIDLPEQNAPPPAPTPTIKLPPPLPVAGQ